MAEQRRRSSRGKPAATKERAKPTTKRKPAAGANKRNAPAKNSSAVKAPARRPSTKKSPAATDGIASEAKPQSANGANDWAVIPPGEAKPPKAPAKPAATFRPRLPVTTPPRRGGGIPVLIGGLLLAAAAAVALALILSGNDESVGIQTSSTPTAVALTPRETSTIPAQSPPPAAAPAPKPTTRSTNCDPIIGSGTANSGRSYAVTSSATGGDPAGCGEAHSVLLSALNGGGAAIGEWHCTTQPSGRTIASCTAPGGRKIQARG
jgi:hypothetical protein